MNSRHVDAHHRLFGVEHELGQRLAELGLADAGGPEEHERAAGPMRIRQPRARAADRIRHRLYRLVLADHARAPGPPPCAAAYRARPRACATRECRSTSRRSRRPRLRSPNCAAADWASAPPRAPWRGAARARGCVRTAAPTCGRDPEHGAPCRDPAAHAPVPL